jgi:hypothetical protein
MPGFLEDQDVVNRSDVLLRPAQGQMPPGWLQTAASDSNAQAWSWLAGRLAANGLSVSQILTWAAGGAWQAELALYFLSVKARLDLARTGEESVVKELPDPRKSWENIVLLDGSNNPIIPVVTAGVESGAVGYSTGRKGPDGRPLRGERMYDSSSPDGFRRF